MTTTMTTSGETCLSVVLSADHLNSAFTVTALGQLRAHALTKSFRDSHFTKSASAALAKRLVELFRKHKDEEMVVQAVLQVANTLSLEPRTTRALTGAGFLSCLAHTLNNNTGTITLIYDAALIAKNMCINDTRVREEHYNRIAESVIQALVIFHPAKLGNPFDPVNALEATMGLLESSAGGKAAVRNAFATTLGGAFSISEGDAAANFLLSRSLADSDARALAEEGVILDTLDVLELHPGAASSANLLFLLANLMMVKDICNSLTVGQLRRVLAAMEIVVAERLDDQRAQLSVMKLLHHLTLHKPLRRGLFERCTWKHCLKVFNHYASAPTASVNTELLTACVKPISCLAEDRRNHVDVPDAILDFLSRVTAAGTLPGGVLTVVGEATTRLVNGSPGVLARLQTAMEAAMSTASGDEDRTAGASGSGSGSGAGVSIATE